MSMGMIVRVVVSIRFHRVFRFGKKVGGLFCVLFGLSRQVVEHLIHLGLVLTSALRTKGYAIKPMRIPVPMNPAFVPQEILGVPDPEPPPLPLLLSFPFPF